MEAPNCSTSRPCLPVIFKTLQHGLNSVEQEFEGKSSNVRPPLKLCHSALARFIIASSSVSDDSNTLRLVLAFYKP